MTDLITEARRRIAELEAELAELHQFVAVADRLASGRRGPVENVPSVGAPQISVRTTQSANAFRGSPTKEILASLFAILSEDGEMLDRNTLLERLSERGVTVPGMYPNKNLATILWRNQTLFEHVQGEGYRWTGVSLEDGLKRRPNSKK